MAEKTRRKPHKRQGQADLDRDYIYDCVVMLLAMAYGAFMGWLLWTM